jgi:MFS family permease
MFASLRAHPSFALLWVSNLFFFGGVWSLTLVLGWLAFELTGSEMLVAVYTAARLAPLLLGPLAGALADRHNRIRLLLLAAGWAAVATFLLAALAGAGLLPYWALVVGGFALGLAQSPSQPARASLVLDIVGHENLSNANALNALAMNMTQVFGPALGGVLIGSLGAPAALWVSGAWFVVSFILLVPLRRIATAHVRDAEHEPIATMVAGGFRAVRAVPMAVAVLGVTVVANLLLWPIYQSFMPVFAERQFGLNADGLGLLLTCSGVGGLVGALVIARLGDFRFKGGVFVIGTALWAALWAVFALVHEVAAGFVLMALIGLASSAFGVLQTTLLLMMTTPDVHGRVLGIQELAIGVMPLAALGLGAIAEVAGVGWTAFGAGILMVAFLAVLAVRMPRLLAYTRGYPGPEEGKRAWRASAMRSPQ